MMNFSFPGMVRLCCPADLVLSLPGQPPKSWDYRVCHQCPTYSISIQDQSHLSFCLRYSSNLYLKFSLEGKGKVYCDLVNHDYCTQCLALCVLWL